MRVPLQRLLAWAGTGLPVAALGLPLVVYLPPHYAGTLGLPLATVGFLFAFVRILDIPLDPLLGAALDRTSTRFGRFRVWLAGGGAILALGVGLMFMATPGVSAGATFLALFILYLGFSATNLAQLSWGAQLSPDYAERARIFGMWTAFNVAGTMVVLFIPPLVAALLPGATPTDGIHGMGWFIIALVPLTVGAAILLVHEPAGGKAGHAIRLADVRAILADPRMQRLLLVDLLLSAAPGITGALFLFFFMAARGLSQDEASLLLLWYFIAGLVAAPAWVRLASRWGKHRATALAALILGLAQLGVILVPASPGWLPILAMVVAGLPFAAGPFLLRAMMADLADAQALDRRSLGQPEMDATGLNYALLTATAKLGYALPVGLTYPLLGLIGFDATPGAANSPEAIRGLELVYVVPVMALALAAAAIVWRWPITAAAHAAIRAQLDARAAS